jgi:hypothetical protein
VHLLDCGANCTECKTKDHPAREKASPGYDPYFDDSYLRPHDSTLPIKMSRNLVTFMSAPNDRNRTHNYSGKNKLHESPSIPMIKTKDLRDEVPGV